MKEKRKVRGQLGVYLQWPLLLSILIIIMTVVVGTIDTTAGLAMCGFAILYMIIAIFLYAYKRKGIMAVKRRENRFARCPAFWLCTFSCLVESVVAVYFAAFTEVMWGFGPSYQYKKPSISMMSPTCRFLTAVYTSVVLSQR